MPTAPAQGTGHSGGILPLPGLILASGEGRPRASGEGKPHASLGRRPPSLTGGEDPTPPGEGDPVPHGREGESVSHRGEETLRLT